MEHTTEPGYTEPSLWLGGVMGEALAGESPADPTAARGGSSAAAPDSALGLIDFAGVHQAGVTRPALQQPSTLVASRSRTVTRPSP